METIYNYSDYRQFIKDYYETKKAQNPAFSYRYLAQKAGVNSSAFFKFIMDGKRNLTKSTLLKTCIALKFNDNEAEYFENLVFFNQAKSLNEKNHFFDKLINLQKLRDVKTIDKDHYTYFGQWYHCVIRELIVLIDFKNNYAQLAKMVRPNITASQAKESVNLLLDLGFLTVVNGKYKQSDPVITTGPTIKAHQVIKFQIEMLHNAINSFENADEKERFASTTTLSISFETYKQMLKKVRNFKSHLMELAKNDMAPEIVYQLNLNLFPLSKMKRNGGQI